MAILMRHRALLFGIIGGFILYSAFVPQYQVAAMVMAASSMGGFLGIIWSVGGYNTSIHKVAMIDLAGIGFLLIAVVMKLVEARS